MINYTIAQHTVAFPTKVLAREGGKHIYNVKLKEAVDNGNIIARDAWLGLDQYEQGAAPTGKLSGVVRQKAANGNYYVEITANDGGLFVYQVPMIEEDWTNNFKKESNFYNEKGEIVRAYELAVGDIVEVSEAGFAATPSIGATVTTALVSGATYTCQLA